MALAQFRIYSRVEFINYILHNNFSRPIKFIQNHHTWKPRYQNLSAQHDEMYWLESMRNTHIKERGWKDIGQHITTFPSGNIALCRPLNSIPAGIYGANTGAICIEHFGNFDEGGDKMTRAHKKSIIHLNAILCIKYGLKPVPSQIVYHHWYTTKGKLFSADEINSGNVLQKKLQKTCPGTAFFHKPADGFKGNTILSAQKRFYPPITTAIKTLQKIQITTPVSVQKEVTANVLNVRSGKGTEFSIIRQLKKGDLVNVFESTSNWARINANSEEWVSAKYLI